MDAPTFRATLEIIGVNPYVFVPEAILAGILAEAGRSRGPIPVHGTVDGAPFRQTLVRFQGPWRLYVNTGMVRDSPRRVGDTFTFTLAYDPEPRGFEPPEAFRRALAAAPEAARAFAALPPSRQTEIVRYLARLRSEEALARNVERAVAFLEGRGRFVGRAPG